MPLRGALGWKVRLGLASILGVGYDAARFAAGVWKKLDREGVCFCVLGGFWVDDGVCWVSGGVLVLVSRKSSHPESI